MRFANSRLKYKSSEAPSRPYLNLRVEGALKPGAFELRSRLEGVLNKGLGGLGLPGDLSSVSRFIKAAFVRANSVSGKDESSNVSQFFHILGSVDQQRGAVIYGDGEYEITVYAACINASKGFYYYHTYDNPRINKVDMHRENLEGSEISVFPLQDKLDILEVN